MPPAKDPFFKFIVYGGGSYNKQQPSRIKDRKLSPAKEAPKAQYFAVLEYTASDKWYETWKSASGKERKGLLERLDQRLQVVKQRAEAAGRHVVNIDDVVAVVGVAGSYPCDGDVERILSDPKNATKYPMLVAMFKARRFVFFQFTAVVASPKVVGAVTGASSAAAASGSGDHAPRS